MASETIDIRIIDDVKKSTAELQNRINDSSLPREKKDLATAKLAETTSLLNKGLDITEAELRRVSANIRNITNLLVKASASSGDFIKGLDALQEKLERATNTRQQARDTKRSLERHSLKVDESGNVIGIRDAEALRVLKKSPVTNAKGEEIITLDAVKNAAASGNQAARHFFDLVKQRLDELTNQYNLAKITDTSSTETIRKTTEEIDALKQSAPGDSAAVKIQEFGNELQNLIDKIRTLVQNSNVQPSNNEKGFSTSGELLSLSKDTNQKTNNSSSIGKAIKQFSIYAIALRTIRSAAREAARTISELDRYLTEQAMVTGKTRKETYNLLKTYQQMALETGATTKEVAAVATQYMRQGKTTADALTLTRAAIEAAKVANIDTAESVNYLTTALNGFQLSAEEAMKVSDKFASIAAQSATSYEEIATALSKVAAQANLAGMSIDYTTALLAKGIETTREAPETIGTALKTVIARMREITDYGQTLEDGMDFNNVETQLGYVGIALKNQAGELRSTEEVLDELGKKWDTLNSNQQAAVAKALAGTRQQSRLIAMMTDYERVTELQEIAQRSAGATAAQAEIYMQGMEAALNKVSVTWEKIVTTVTDSDAIVGLIGNIANLLEFLNDILSNDIALVSTMVLLGSTLLINLTSRLEMQKAHNRALLQEEKSKRAKIVLDKQEYVENLKNYLTAIKEGRAEKDTLKTLYKQNQQRAIANNDMAAAAKYAGLIAQLDAESVDSTAVQANIEKEIALTESEVTGLKIQQTQADMQILQNGQGFVSILGNALSILTPILTVMSLINMVQQAINAKKLRSIALTKAEAKEETKGLLPKVSGMFAKIVQAFSSGGIPGVIAGIALATTLAAALGVGIAASMGAFNQGSAADNAADNVNKLSSEIYKLTERANAIKTIEDQFDALDKKIVKTTEDQAKMNELLESAADKLSSEEDSNGQSQQSIYNSLNTETKKLEYLKKIELETIEEVNKKRQEQLNIIKALSEEERISILRSTDSASALQIQDAIYANNNATLYDYIDSLDQAYEGVEELTQAILENIDAETAWAYASDSSGAKIKQLVDTINSSYRTLNDETVSFAEILNSDDYALSERIEAYRELQKVIMGTGDSNLVASFQAAYQQWDTLSTKFNDATISFLERANVSIEALNDFATALQKLGFTTDETIDKFQHMAELLSAGAGIQDTIERVFSQELSRATDLDEWQAIYTKILNAYENMTSTTVLNIGQNLTKLRNRIDNIYETATKWASMTDQEKTEFMSENRDLFAGDDNLYNAFQSQNFGQIAAALGNNERLRESIRLQLQELEIALDIEKARRETGEADENYIVYLEKQIDLLKDYEDASAEIYKASLQKRLDQEEEQLSIYKDYLKKQQEALEDSLDKRREAYSDYFDKVNQAAEDEDYEEQMSLLISNLAKLQGSDFTRAEQVDLEQQIKDLEQERLQDLRERAQEQVLNNIDTQIEEISEKFDKLLENNQLLLQAMLSQSNVDSSGLLTNLLVSNLEGQTLTGAESYLQNFSSIFGSLFSSALLDSISVTPGANGNIILNVNGQPIELSEKSERDLYETIAEALRQLGLR